MTGPLSTGQDLEYSFVNEEYFVPDPSAICKNLGAS